MKHKIPRTLLTLGLALAWAAPAYAEPDGLTGKWELVFKRGSNERRTEIELQSKGKKFSGKSTERRGARLFQGEVFSSRKGTLIYILEQGQRRDRGPLAIYSGTLEGDTIKGTRHNLRKETAKFTLKKMQSEGAGVDWRHTWLDLQASENSCWGGQDDLRKTGMRVLYCHLASLMSYRALWDAVGFSIFRSGPHTARGLNLRSDSFGRYNPKFVRWLSDKALIAASDRRFASRTQRTYEEDLQNLARLYLSTRMMFLANPEYYERQAKQYSSFERHRPDPAHVAALQKKWPRLYRRAHAYWVRRRIDGSANAFEDALRKLMRIYDRDGMRRISKQSWKVQPSAQMPPPSGERTCRDVLIDKGHRSSQLRRCRGVDNECAVLLLDAGRRPSELRHCKGSPPNLCVAALMKANHAPSAIRHCYGVHEACAVKLLERGSRPSELRNCR